MIKERIHRWKFDDDADPRQHWPCVVANKGFVGGCAEIKLLAASPWGPHPLSN
jgi:hypothetical protein